MEMKHLKTVPTLLQFGIFSDAENTSKIKKKPSKEQVHQP